MYEEFGFGDRAELLGAIYGDGYVQKRSRWGSKVSVAVSDGWPAWLHRVPELFELVFKRGVNVAKKKRRATSTKNYEFYVTTRDMEQVFGVAAKYTKERHIKPPMWIEADPEHLRRFIRGLVETDGNFSVDPTDGTPTFSLSQKNDYLSAWFVTRLRCLGYQCINSWANRASVNQPTLAHFAEVRRFGEWTQSEKWAAIKDQIAGKPMVVDRKAGGIQVRARPRKVLKTVPLEEQERWRAWRTLGASHLAIARHVGRSANVVWDAVRDIVPEAPATAEQLGLEPRPRYPKRATSKTIERWRSAAETGESSASIGKRENVAAAVITDAVIDIRWKQQLAKRVQEEKRLARMMTAPEGLGRWTEDL